MSFNINIFFVFIVQITAEVVMQTGISMANKLIVCMNEIQFQDISIIFLGAAPVEASSDVEIPQGMFSIINFVC